MQNHYSTNRPEEWRDIPGFDGSYQVSNFGQVRSLDRCLMSSNNGKPYVKKHRGRILKQHTNRGYKYITVSFNGKLYTLKVHRCVGEAFLDNPNNYGDINHKNGDRADNSVDNLEWCTRQHNIQHSYYVTNREPSGCKRVYCIETDTTYNSCMEAGRQLEIDSSSIASVAKGKYKQIKGFHFKFI